MRIKIVSPEKLDGVIECQEDGSFIIAEGQITIEQMAEELRLVRPNSATGLVNTVNSRPEFVLRSLEYVGWFVEWPEVAGAEVGDQSEEHEPGDFNVN
ncbi:hypothetical protein KGP24_24095 (plasmid) [Enterobacter sp. JBIWA008]|uniref:hypothetical protein n=1 Tax=Enterobacter sp. JBIWA008 TaxID=2831892 RepID=UPI001CBF37D2|nr:hypothetical protein [Enterobacter sp. JBIWA008]UAN43371.1 hypothetical protein KGP24_24095 [Enterobacter sp. JBIWA008]HEW9972618.1 hypothetical protein [Enterobacter cloacae]